MLENIIHVALYARVSTDTQDYQRQIEDLKRQISQDYKGVAYDIIEFAENVSGFNDNKAKLNELDSIIKNTPGYFDCVYVSELSRLGRKPNDVYILLSGWDNKGVAFYIGGNTKQKSILPGGLRNNMMWMSISMFAEYASIEATLTKDRSKSALLHYASIGHAGGSANLPYGYTKTADKMLIIDEEEAEVIKRIFQMYSEKNGIKVIANSLNADGILTRGRKIFAGRTFERHRKSPRVSEIKGQKIGEKISEIIGDNLIFVDKTIHDIITNTIYKGDRRYKGHILKAPAIIGTELFDECNALLKSKSHSNQLTSYTYLLRNLLICGCCGKTYMGRYKPTHKHDKIYSCPSRLRKGGTCGNVGVNIVLIESVIFECYHNLKKIHLELSDRKTHKKEIESEIKRLQNSLKLELKKKDNSKTDNLINLFLSGRISELKYDEKKQEIDVENVTIINNIQKIELKIKERKQILIRLDQPHKTDNILLAAKDNRVELAALFKQFISKIIINQLDTNHVLITIFNYLDGVIKSNQVCLLLDVSGIRKRPKQYLYRILNSKELKAVYKDNVLVSDKPELLNNFATNLSSRYLYKLENKNLIDNMCASID